MSRTWAVIKREFLEGVRTKTFIFGTLFGPILMILLLAGPILLSEAGGGGRSTIAILDETGAGLGQGVADGLAAASAQVENDNSQTVFTTEVYDVPAGMADTRIEEVRNRIENDELDGYLLLPAGLVEGGSAVYEGKNASAQRITRDIDRAVLTTVRQKRLDEAGIPPQAMARVMAPVPVDKRKYGGEEQAGRAEAAIAVGYLMAFAIYMGVILYGAAVARGVLEEKRDRIVEVILSSIKPQSFMTGKVIGIGSTGLVQMSVWALFGVILVTQADTIMGMLGQTDLPPLPSIPAVVVFNFLFFFVTGFFLYGAMFAAMGAIATNDQEMQQLQFPVLIPLIFGFFMMMPVIENPNSGIVTVGTLIPFTAPLVLPMRSAVVDIPLTEWLGSIVLMVATVAFMIWLAAKIYRVAVLSTGKRPTWRELVRMVRTQ